MSRDTKFVHLAWQREEQALSAVRYPMGSDPTGRISRLYGVLDEESGLALRGAFLIDPKGVLLCAETNFYNLGRNIEELLRKLRANIHLAAHPSEGVPAQWRKKGDTTLRPGPKLVGRVGKAMQNKQ